MTRIRIFIVLALAVTVGGVFAFATYRYVQKLPAPTAAAKLQTRPVVIAVANLDLGASLRPEDLRVIDWPAESVPAGAFEHVEDVVGRGMIQPVVQNEAYPAEQARIEGGGRGSAAGDSPGHRALSVRVNDVIGVAGYVLPGTRVDVVATVSPTKQQTDMTSKVDPHERAGARGRHEDRARRRKEQADRRQRRHAAGRIRSKPSD